MAFDLIIEGRDSRRVAASRSARLFEVLALSDEALCKDMRTDLSTVQLVLLTTGR